MSIVDRKSIFLQIQEDPSWTSMSEDDRAVCMALCDALEALRYPRAFGGLPATVSKALLRWRKGKTLAFRAGTTTIRTRLKFADARGLKRTRTHRSNQPTAFEHVAKELGISANTVANKANVRLPQTVRKK